MEGILCNERISAYDKMIKMQITSYQCMTNCIKTKQIILNTSYSPSLPGVIFCGIQIYWGWVQCMVYTADVIIID